MRTRLRMLTLGLACLSALAVAQRPTTVIGAGEGVAGKTPYMQPQGSTVRLYKDTTYVLTGFYYVDSTATLIIEPGTGSPMGTSASLPPERAAPSASSKPILRKIGAYASITPREKPP